MRSVLILSVTLSVVLIGCEPKPQPIQYGSDECAYCRMIVTDAEFASQMVNNQGKAYKFDSVECMVAFDITNEDPENIHSKWVPNFHDTDEWLEAESAAYLHSETLRSPMGMNISAYSDRSSAEEMKEEYGGEIVDYSGLKKIVETEWLANHQNHNHHQR